MIHISIFFLDQRGSRLEVLSTYKKQVFQFVDIMIIYQHVFTSVVAFLQFTYAIYYITGRQARRQVILPLFTYSTSLPWPFGIIWYVLYTEGIGECSPQLKNISVFNFKFVHHNIFPILLALSSWVCSHHMEVNKYIGLIKASSLYMCTGIFNILNKTNKDQGGKIKICQIENWIACLICFKINSNKLFEFILDQPWVNKKLSGPKSKLVVRVCRPIYEHFHIYIHLSGLS